MGDGRATSILSEPSDLPALVTAPAGHRGAEDFAAARSVRGARLQKKLMDAALALIAEGDLRPTLAAITARAGVRSTAINEQFGYLHLMFRQLVRERPVDVLLALRLPGDLPEVERIELAWMILTGARRERIGAAS